VIHRGWPLCGENPEEPMKKTLIAVLAASALLAPVAPADARCRTAACHDRVYMKNTIRPHIPWLRATGYCEAARRPGGYSLKAGLRAYNPAGPYLGRYQFDRASWRGAGGTGDPRDAGWLMQAYRAVRWKQIAGSGAWPVCG
jgi:hypothetical protein